MTKIKILGLIIIGLIGALVYMFDYTMHQNKISNNLQQAIDEQKSYTQEISKDVFYIYKNNSASTNNIDKNIKNFINKIKNKDEVLAPIDSIEIRQQSEVIIKLWEKFYKQVQDFKQLNSVTSAYSSIILQQIVKDIYHTNLNMVVEFDKLEKIHEAQTIDKITKYKFFEYSFLVVLMFLLLYMFTQVKEIISFIQKFSSTSKKIISTSSIRDIEPITTSQSSLELKEVSDNFNILVQKIDDSIEHASASIQISCEALDSVEDEIENFLELIDEMNDDAIDKELTKKEDVLIHSLEELTSSAQKLKNLKKDFLTLVKLS